MKKLLGHFTVGMSLSLFAAPPIAAQPASSLPQTEQAKSERIFFNSEAADDEALGKATAREDISAVARSNQTSNSSQNSVNGTSTTGDIVIADNAFQNASGLTIINANSGNNVSMNASMNVNIILTPPTGQ